jgi:hypothetical protein
MSCRSADDLSTLNNHSTVSNSSGHTKDENLYTIDSKQDVPAEPPSPSRARDVEAQVPPPNDVVETYPAPVKVPRSQRRGLLGRFTILAEVEEPKYYSNRTKWFITFVVAFSAMAAPLGSAIFFREYFEVLYQIQCL